MKHWNCIKLPLVDALDAEWTQATPQAPLFFQPTWLLGLEQNNSGWESEGWRWYREDGTVAARAVVYRTSVSTQQGDSYIQTDRASTGGAFRKLLRRWAPQGFATTVVGSLFATDLEPVFFAPDIRPSERQSIEQDLANELLQERTRVLLVKDVPVPMPTEQKHWIQRGYHPYEVEPLMELTFDPNWTDESEYWAAFKTKFRTKAQSVRNKSAACKAVKVRPEDWKKWLPDIRTLYDQVESRAGFKLHPFPIETLGTWLHEAGDAVHLTAYLHGDDQKPVGFRFGWIHNSALHALFVGMDYSQHRDLCIYPRMLYDFAEFGIQHRANTVHFGRTAAEMKSALGAVPLRSAGLTRATNPLLNAMIRPFLKKTLPPTYRVDQPFKKLAVLIPLLGLSASNFSLHAQHEEPRGLDYSQSSSWALRPELPIPHPDLQRERYQPRTGTPIRPAVFYIYPTFYDRGSSWGVDPRDPKHREEVLSKALPNQAGVFLSRADVYVPYYRQMRIDGYYTQKPDEKLKAKQAFDTAYADVRRAYLHFLTNLSPNTPIVLASHSQGTNHAERLLREYILPDSAQRSRLLLAYLIGMPIQKNAFGSYCQPCSTPRETGCFVSWRTFGKNYFPPVHGPEIAVVNPITWDATQPQNQPEEHRGILFGTGRLRQAESLVVSIDSGTLQVRELHMPLAFLYRWKNYHVGDYNLFWNNIQENFGVRVDSWSVSAP